MSDPIRSGSVAGDVEQAVAEVVAEITDRLQAGQGVDVEAYIARCPEAAERLRRLVPALQVMEALKSAPADGDTQEEGLTGTLGDYRILREVGRGGMGVVYEAEQISLGRRVALKVLPFAATADARQLKRFHNEARAAASLEHPGVVPVYGVGCERGVHFYAMRFIDGRTLAEMIESLRGEGQPHPTTPYSPGEPAPPSETTVVAKTTNPAPRDAAYFRRVAEWMAQAAEALEHAHQIGVIHRDVKPHNLMVDEQGKLWVTDFGLARLAADSGLTMSGDLLGTLRYMAPEQALARTGLVDHRADVYGLGATLYEMLTLRPAVTGDDRKEVLYQIAFEEPIAPGRLNRSVPRDLETVVLRALEKSPGDRYGSAAEMAEDLRRFMEDRTIRARRASPTQRARKWVRRNRAAVWAAAAVLLVTLSLGVSVGIDRLQQRAAAEREAEVAMSEASRLREEGKTRDALLMARHAGLLLLNGQLSTRLGQEVRQRLNDLDMLVRVEECRVQGSEVKDGKFDEEAVTAAYELAFREYGIDVAAISPSETADRVMASAIRDELISALDDWATRTPRGKPGREGLIAVVRLADSDQSWNRIYDAEAKKDFRALKELAQSEAHLSPFMKKRLAWAFLYCGRDEEAISLLREVQLRHPNDYWVNDLLGDWYSRLMKRPQFEEALRFYSVAAGLRPDSPGSRLNLANVLWMLGKQDEAIDEYRRVIRLKPDYAKAHCSLGMAFSEQGKLEEAVDELRQAISIQPNFANARFRLGYSLEKQGKIEVSIDEYRRVIQLKPDWAAPHYNLGISLAKQGKLEEAGASFRQAIRIEPEYAEAFLELGVVFAKQKKLDEAIEAYRRAVKHKPNLAVAYFNLGLAFYAQGNLGKAINEYRQAVRTKPDYHQAIYGLAMSLAKQGKNDEAVAQFRHAVRIRPDWAEAYFELSTAYAKQGKWEEAINEIRQAIRLKPDYAQAHCNLGQALIIRGQFKAAVEALQRGHELGSKRKDWLYDSAGWLREAQQLARLNERLSAVLKGEAQPADVNERLVFAQMCQSQGRHAPAARFFGESFAARPAIAQDMAAGHRYNAACSAALAAGQGEDATGQGAMERLAWRRQALTWLAADLIAWRKLFDKDRPKVQPIVVKSMKHWLADTDLASVRAPDALAKLPFGERQAWRQFWADVTGLLARAEKALALTQPRK